MVSFGWMARLVMTVVIMSDEFLFCCVLWYKPAGQSISRCAEQRYISVYITFATLYLDSMFRNHQ
jgi:hypothetical protein